MVKPYALKKGDKVAIVSLSGGMLGEDFCKHDIELGRRRLNELGLEMVIMPNALKGIDFLQKHPECRAADLKEAFSDESIKGIVCAIGGVDTYRLLSYLLEDEEFIANVKKHPKVFTGFSDSTTNHLMFYKLGLTTFYGPNFINDLAELADDMLPYTRDAFTRYMGEKASEPIVPSDVWYEERTDFSPDSIGTNRKSHNEDSGFELLQGSSKFSGKLLGGCLDTIYDLLTGIDNPDAAVECKRFGLFPELPEWENTILFIETSENCMPPERLRDILLEFKKRGILDTVNGIIVGKPQNEVFFKEYKAIYLDVLKDNPELPVLYNVNFGHAYPRTVLAYGAEVLVDADMQAIYYKEKIVK